MGVEVDALDTTTTDKGEYFSFRKRVPGRATAEILWEALPEMIAGIYFPKTMYWTGKGGVRFIRPIRWIVALLGENVVPFDVAGVESGRTTSGHRILGSRKSIEVSIENYEEKLRENFVLVHAAERRARIEAGLGPDVQPDEELLHTLTYLTEYPTPIRGSFDAQYLKLPKEILSTVMRHHQRYFSVLKPDGTLSPEFVAVTNTDGDPDGLIRNGNERVLRARFNDARFFWQVDQQKKLADRVNDLAKITFQAKLDQPTYKDKTLRMVELSRKLTDALGIDASATVRAAELSKTDLTTDMVKEFTELQGVVGGLYARAQEEPEEVAAAIYDHYKPVSMEDSIPRTAAGQVVALADKLDTLRECFRVGLIPSGSKDPFALRRAAQGVIKILFEARLSVSLDDFVQQPELREFLRDRVAYYLRENYPYDEVNAVMARPFAHLAELGDRIEAIHRVRPTPNFEPLAASFKRIQNILRQAQVDGPMALDPEKLAPGPEQDLYNAFKKVSGEVAQSADFYANLASIASLRPQVDLFFDKILVNDPDPAIRQNRLALLQGLLTEFSTIADFSEIVTQGVSAQS
jgi:glycyl-tRNA synthetase beta chain